MSGAVDVCLLIEGGYPYVLGGVASWTDGLIRSMPDRTFHVVALITSTQDRTHKYALPDNVLGLTEVVLNDSPTGRRFVRTDAAAASVVLSRIQAILTTDEGDEFGAMMVELSKTGLGSRILLDSREAWNAMERAYETMMPTAPLVDFFWTWRFFARSLLAIAAAPIPDARVFHALSTGYAGLLGARAKCVRQRPLAITEHGIYTNERRIEIGVAEWIYESGGSGFNVQDRQQQMRDIWQGAFTNFSRISYNLADTVTTLYRANQLFQLQDGASEHKLQVIPNGIDFEQFSKIESSPEARPPRAILIGRVVPIKDIRTYIMAVAILKRLVPDVEAMILGPEDEDPTYAAECRELAQQQGLDGTLHFLGGVKDIKRHLGSADVVVLTSISEAQPLVILEAGAAGLPSVATDVGSCREMLEGDRGDAESEAGGFVVPACEPQAVAEAVAKILLDPELKRRMGQVMRKRVESTYNKKCVNQMYASMYDTLSKSGVRAAEAGMRASWRE